MALQTGQMGALHRLKLGFLKISFSQNLIFALVIFWSICHISRVYLPLVDSRSILRLVSELVSILNCILFDLQGKRFKNFSNGFFV